MRKLAALICTVGLLGIAGQAGATTFWTLQASVPIAMGGVSGSIDPVGSFAGALGLTDVGGNLVPDEGGAVQGTDVFVVDITLSGGSASIDEVGITLGTALFFLNPVEAGAYADAGTAPGSVLADDQINFQGLFDFSGDTIDAGETSVRLFVTYSPEGDVLGGETVNFMISSGTDFTVQGLVIPEPATLALVATGLALVGVARSRRRSI
jgi:hypothetical protein